MRLIIVESPAKCAKIQEYAGSDYKVMSSMGHIRALKQDLEAVGINRDWVPQYENMQTKAKTIRDLKENAHLASEVILATDDDREGEGIAYHICAILKLDPTTCPRIVFHSITKQAIQTALQNKRTIDLNKFHSQQTRAMLDMMIGYTLSPVLWKQLNSNGLALSAGRCQTPALKLVLDRDLEIENHAAKRFWSLAALFTLNALKPIEAKCDKLESDTLTSEYLQQITKDAKSRLTHLKESTRTHSAPKPLITSSLQQEASKTYNLNPKATMAAAQKLYEAGHITYMRTDNAFLSTEGADLCRAEIVKRCGENYLGLEGQHQEQTQEQQSTAPKPKTKTKTKKHAKEQEQKQEAQAAHEAIRPTHPETDTVEDLGPAEEKVYRLIWQRALQSQMAVAKEDVRTLTFTIDNDPEQKPWLSEQSKTNFLGWKLLTQTDKTDQTNKDNEALWILWSTIAINTAAKWVSVTAEEGFTKSASRFTEASLIHELEAKGIGRPSTFASLVTTIVDRDYVEKSDSAGTQLDIRKWTIKTPNTWPPNEQKLKQTVGKESNKLQATPLGRTVAEFLYKHYDDIFAYSYTAQMERELDLVAKGERSWKQLLQSNWDLYKARYETHTTTVLDPESKKQATNKKRDLGDGITVVLTRKGPLLLKEETKDFASLPAGSSFETVTLKQAQNAYMLKSGLDFGTYEGIALKKKKGPYGYYIQYDKMNLPCKPDDTVESIIEKIKQKQSQSQTQEQNQEPAYERKVGDYTIKKGPYGLYFFKHTLKKATFVTFPKTSDPDKVTAADMPALFQMGMNAKVHAKKPKATNATKAEKATKAKKANNPLVGETQ
jgi:DNA topoisomerase-1